MALGSYTVGAVIGRGEFATVKLGEHVSKGQKVAMKWLDKSRLDQKVQREITNQRGLCHKNVIKIEDVIETDDSICLILEYAPGGDLFDYIVRHVRLQEDEARRIFRQLISGIEHCHEQNVVHRDLKPDNILMDADFNIKIADFGLSSQWEKGELLTESCGSPNYAAPELLYKDCRYEGPEIDVWSCGVVLYTLLCGSLPFDDESIPSLFRKIKQGKYTVPGYVSPLSKDLLTKMLTVCPAARINLTGIREHPWFKELSAAEMAEQAALKRAEEAANAPADPAVAAAAVAEEQLAASTISRCSRVAKSTQRLRKVYSRSMPKTKSASCPIGAMLLSVHA